MTAPLFIRRYRPEDRAACLALFDSNVPTFFIEPERRMFAEFLEQPPGTYLVIEGPAGQLVACGGVVARDGAQAILCWAMVELQKHREGIGRVLLCVRLALAARTPGVSRVGTNTSNANAPFFEREGLRIVKTIDNYFRPSVQLECALDATRRAQIETRLSATLAQGHRLEDGLLTGG